MNRSEVIRHNAKILLGHVRGKTKAERQAIYSMVSGGPLGIMAHIASTIVQAQTRVNVDVASFSTGHEKMIREIERGARAAVRSEQKFRL